MCRPLVSSMCCYPSNAGQRVCRPWQQFVGHHHLLCCWTTISVSNRCSSTVCRHRFSAFCIDLPLSGTVFCLVVIAHVSSCGVVL
ncbi:hypothetical protein VIGAN_05144200 [Vigna angularis var. angularis]|uniref:Uncharacterized protein n=1 Tax=Vigna angularis var. angularis TaxID=157739 RepID=A0A0S3S597_PHAAN|nr:hypothetical protein VIGAN_05144200 [Vigna angularis var. angularis]